MKTLLLIDAHSLLHRCYHALPPMSSPDGRPTQALYGVSTILEKIAEKEKPDYIAAAFDRPEPTFRKQVYEAYKAHRPKAEDSLVSQLIEARTLFSRFGVPVLEKPGFEGDDIIATLATKFAKKDALRVVILTGDLDTLQIVQDDTIVVRTFRRGLSDTFTYNEDAVKERYGLLPSQMRDYKALVGDTSDNIKGVPGIGEKTAAALLTTYGSIENMIAHLGEDPKAEKKIAPYTKEMEMSKFLVTVDRNVETGVSSLKDLEYSGPDKKVLYAYFSELGFESLLRRMMGGPQTGAPAATPKPHAKRAPRSGGLFAPAVSVAPTGKSRAVFVHESITDDVALCGDLPKVGFDLKEVLKGLWGDGKDMKGPYVDLGVAFWLLDPDFRTYSPEEISAAFLKKEWEEDTAHYEELYGFAMERLRQLGMKDLFEKCEMELLPLLARMEAWGIAIDNESLKTLEKEMESILAATTKKIYEAAGEEFNINSPKQLAHILFEKLRLGGKQKGKVTTSADKLEEMKGEHDIIPLILSYREDFKILSTYVRPLQNLRAQDKRLHTQFIQTGTGTGRLSSRDPNLQNIPQESQWAPHLRAAFHADTGMSFLSFDYSQLELRILADVTKDEALTEAFLSGRDIHTLTASKIFSVAIADVTKEQRRVAKTLNFGLVYGMGVSAFAKESGLARSRAQEFIDAYFATFSRVREWQEQVKSDLHALGFTQTKSGRRRYFPDLASAAPRYVAEAERAGVNHPIQGLEADVVKFAMIRVKEALEKKGVWGGEVKMLLSIHDELLFEVSDGIIDSIEPLIRHEMVNAYPLDVPLLVEAKKGKTWGAMKSL